MSVLNLEQAGKKLFIFAGPSTKVLAVLVGVVVVVAVVLGRVWRHRPCMVANAIFCLFILVTFIFLMSWQRVKFFNVKLFLALSFPLMWLRMLVKCNL